MIDRHSTAVRAAAIALALALATPVAAAPPEFGQDMAAGQARMEAGDPEGAILHYESALERIDVAKEANAIANALPLVVTARIEAQRKTGDVEHLRAARATVQRLLGELDRIHGAQASAQPLHEVATKQRERIDAALAEATATVEPDPTAEPTRVAPSPSPGPATSDAPPPKRTDRTRVGLIAGGATALVLGTGGLAAMIAGLAIGKSKRDEGRRRIEDESPGDLVDVTNAGYRSNTLAIAGGVVGGVLVATGTVLVILGARRPRNVAFAPAPGRRALGWTMTLRF